MILEARDIVVRRAERRVIDGCSLALDAGQAVALVGPNAAGKSTLLRALAGLLPTAAGQVFLDGRPSGEVTRSAMARAIALVSADEGALSPLRVGDRVALGRYPYMGPFRAGSAADAAAIERAITRTGIAHLVSRPLERLSAGERQLAALARGLAQEPRVLLLDEPAAHLDVGHELQLFRILDEVRREGVAVLAVVHDLQRAAAWAERLALLDAGRIVAEGAPGAVLASEAAAKAFGVAIRAHTVPGATRPFYSFE
jgi:iron complex transport system ATP-binding protein